MSTREIIERLEKISKMVNWAELNRSPEDFIRIRLEINALLEEIRSHGGNDGEISQDFHKRRMGNVE